MTHRKKIVAVSASLGSPSKTTTLAQTLLAAVADKFAADATLIELGPIAAELGGTLNRIAAPHAVEKALRAVEDADVLIAASPVFRGAYSGHFKHFFDLVYFDSLLNKPVILAASGGGPKHCLVVEHHLRPLFAFFQAFTLPTSIYVCDADFESGRLTSVAVHGRVSAVANEASRFLNPSNDSLPTLSEIAQWDAAQRVS